MRLLRLLVPPVLLALAAGSGVQLDRAREATGAAPTAARIPLGGFEPLAVNLLWLRAEELRREGRLTAAVDRYRLAIELQPRVADGWVFLARAVGWTRSEVADPERSWRWVAEGLAILDRGLARNPGNVELLFEKGRLYFDRLAAKPRMRTVALRELGVPPEEKAAEAFREVLARQPRHPARSYLARALLQLALLREEAGDPEGAVAAAEESLRHLREIAREPSQTGAARLAGELEDFVERLKER